MIDAGRVLKEHLESITAVNDFYTGSIVAGDFAPDGYKPDDGPLLLVIVSGGGQDFSGKVHARPIVFRTIALTEILARDGDRLVYDNLEGKATYVVMAANLSQAPQWGIEDVSLWAFSFSTYDITLRNV